MELKGKISVTSTSIVHGIRKRQSAPSKWSVHHGGNEEACMGFPCSSGGSRRLRKHGCGTDGPGHIPNRQEEPTGWLLAAYWRQGPGLFRGKRATRQGMKGR